MKDPIISDHARKLRDSAILDSGNLPVQPARKYSVASIQRSLEKCAERAKHLNPLNAGAAIQEWVVKAIEAIHTDDWLKTKGEVAIAAARGDRQAQALHAAAVQITTENIVTATSGWVSFFEMRSLGDDEYAVIDPEVLGQQVLIDVIGQDGGNVTVQSQPNDPTPLFCPIQMRSTPWIEYPLVDLYKGGGVKDMALAQFDVARDQAWRMDALLGSFLIVGGTNTRLTATFNTTGTLGERDYYAHPNVNTANLPAGNFVTLPGNSNASLFRKEVFDAIIQYARSWGDNVMEGGSPRPVEIVVASSHVTAFLSQVNLSSETNKLVDQVFDGGIIMSYGGYTWVITGNNTLDPNQGVAYVRMDQPVGIFFDKPSLAKTIQDESPTLQTQNKGRICQMWAESFAMPRHWRKRTFGVRYKTPV